MLDASVRAELLQGQGHSFPVGFWKVVESLLRAGSQEQSSSNEEPQDRSSHLSLWVCNSGSDETTHCQMFFREKEPALPFLREKKESIACFHLGWISIQTGKCFLLPQICGQ